ncbi:PadR family transcriptional regulator [Acinetobacter stercoris]|uniref:Transcriptional regulator YqjI n=1 Tax=Acinetobacter stercoris TaxID=2126983 RepID=A0A2U3MVP1_9GAMM|nr:PadR family transcriptional regulator [Acinetobacter stercoris]SPL69445.1 Transcriptional regulator YqjI [Acinetobacter stercoris]
MKLDKHHHLKDEFDLSEQHAERGHRGRRGRLFEAGRMKALVLYLIQQEPKHGYEIIKEISDLVGGGYSPSPGTIYPTLTYLEDMGFVTVQSTDDDRKQYHITNAGQTHLQQQQQIVTHLLEKLEMRREIHNNDQLLDIHRAMENLKTALRLKLSTAEYDVAQVRKIAEKIDMAAVEIGRL